LQLIKIKITFAVALSTVLGYVLFTGELNTNIILPVLGLFILACSSAVINQYQEYEQDALMNRTQNRPIPAGKIKPKVALFIGFILAILGSVLLYLGSNLMALQLGLLALLWYNGVYTFLKNKTAFAVVPGALIGAIPPIVGWAAAGGSIDDMQILLVAFFFFIWQIPHFWLLLLMHGSDYEKAGFPSLTTIYSFSQLKKITFVWTTATAVSSFMFPMFGVVNSKIETIIIFISAFSLILFFAKSVKADNTELNLKKYFISINIFLLVIMTILMIEGLRF